MPTGPEHARVQPDDLDRRIAGDGGEGRIDAQDVVVAVGDHHGLGSVAEYGRGDQLLFLGFREVMGLGGDHDLLPLVDFFQYLQVATGAPGDHVAEDGDDNRTGKVEQHDLLAPLFADGHQLVGRHGDGDAATDVADLIALHFVAFHAGRLDDQRRHVAMGRAGDHTAAVGEKRQPFLHAGCLEKAQRFGFPRVGLVRRTDRIPAGNVKAYAFGLRGDFGDLPGHESRVDQGKLATEVVGDVALRMLEVGIRLRGLGDRRVEPAVLRTPVTRELDQAK